MEPPSTEEIQDEDKDNPTGSLSSFLLRPSEEPDGANGKGDYRHPPAWAMTQSYIVRSSLEEDPSQHSRAGCSPVSLTVTRRHWAVRPPQGTSSSPRNLPPQQRPSSLETQPSRVDTGFASVDNTRDRFDCPNPRETVVALGALFSQLTHLDLGHWFLHGPVLACIGNNMCCLQVWRWLCWSGMLILFPNSPPCSPHTSHFPSRILFVCSTFPWRDPRSPHRSSTA